MVPGPPPRITRMARDSPSSFSGECRSHNQQHSPLFGQRVNKDARPLPRMATRCLFPMRSPEAPARRIPAPRSAPAVPPGRWPGRADAAGRGLRQALPGRCGACGTAPCPERSRREGERNARGRSSISRVLSAVAPEGGGVATINLGAPLPAPSSILPGGSASNLKAPPYLDLLRMGFTLPAPSPAPRWALAFRPRRDRGPHHFTLTCAHRGPEVPARHRRYVFCGTFRGVAPPGR